MKPRDAVAISGILATKLTDNQSNEQLSIFDTMYSRLAVTNETEHYAASHKKQPVLVKFFRKIINFAPEISAISPKTAGKYFPGCCFIINTALINA